jgi:phenylacetate-CoA ligase
MDRLGLGVMFQDKLKGTRINEEYGVLVNNESLSLEDLNSLQFQKFKRLIDYSYKFVPYYQRLFDEIGLRPGDISSVSDIKNIPILTKELVRSNHQDLISIENHNFSVKQGKTGGTTGSPLNILKDNFDRSITWGAYYRWYRWMGIKQTDKSLTIWGAKTVLSRSLFSDYKMKFSNYLLNNVTIDSFGITPDNIHKFYDIIIKENPKLIKGYLSSIILISSYMKNKGLPPNKDLLAMSCTTESLSLNVRRFIESVFHVPLYDQYGCGEVSSISFECSNQSKHITQEHVYLEILDDKDENVYDTKGRIIVSGLDNYIMPFIRYENGDLSSLVSKSCDCGLPFALMGDIEGRSTDTVTLLNGSVVHGVFFTDIFFELGYSTNLIKRFQIIQYNNFHVKILLEVDDLLSIESLNEIHSVIEKFVKIVKIVQTNYLESSSSGKFKYIIKEGDLY